MIRVFTLMGSLMLLVTMNTAGLAQDAEAGKAKAGTCVACHNTDGNSPLEQFPKIAGQVPGYIADQLARFKSGERPGTVMMGLVAALSEQDMADVDAWYSSQTMTVGAVSPDQEEDARAGEAIYRGGIAEFNVPSCMGCHGPSGSGIPPAYPRLGGQYAVYIEAELKAFKSGVRAHPIMQPIAFVLSDQQIRQLALYLSALQ